MTYAARRAFGDAALEHAEDICKSFLCRRTTVDEDRNTATDYIVGGMRIAVRCRSSRYMKYNDFTLRCTSGLGERSEFERIAQGDVDYLWYGFVDDKGSPVRWYLIDLQLLRAALICTPSIVTGEFANADSRFKTIKLDGDYVIECGGIG